jgi:hypothetical protein
VSPEALAILLLVAYCVGAAATADSANTAFEEYGWGRTDDPVRLFVLLALLLVIVMFWPAWWPSRLARKLVRRSR